MDINWVGYGRYIIEDVDSYPKIDALIYVRQKSTFTY